VHPEDWTAARERIKRVGAGQPVALPAQVRLVRMDGSIFPAEIISASLTFQGVSAMQVIFADVTERKRAEEALARSEERLRDLYENAPDMFVSVDAGTAAITACNETLARTLGFAKDEILGRPVIDLYAPGCLPTVRRCFERFLYDPGDRGRTRHRCVSRQAPDGRDSGRGSS
jgi:PAS domain S-box-containing protein